MSSHPHLRQHDAAGPTMSDKSMSDIASSDDDSVGHFNVNGHTGSPVVASFWPFVLMIQTFQNTSEITTVSNMVFILITQPSNNWLKIFIKVCSSVYY